MSKYQHDSHFNSSFTGKRFYTILLVLCVFFHNGLLFDHKLNIIKVAFSFDFLVVG